MCKVRYGAAQGYHQVIVVVSGATSEGVQYVNFVVYGNVRGAAGSGAYQARAATTV